MQARDETSREPSFDEAHGTQDASKPPAGVGPTILIVEDEQLVALDVSTRLERLGYRVVSVGSGPEALISAEASPPDLVLMDIRLSGGMDGIETAHRIQKTRDVPIIYLTAYADQTTLERARLTEPYGYILKPFNARELNASIEMALRKHESDRQRVHQGELQRFLADASARLAESLDYTTVLDRAAELIVPRYADWCRVCLKRVDDMSQVSTTYPGREDGDGGCDGIIASVIDTARPRLYASVPDLAPLGANLEALHKLALDVRSVMCVPLVAGGRTLGAILLVSAGRQYGPDELAVAEDLAHRISIAIENAFLYREAQRATRMRQQVLAVVSHDLRNALSTILLRSQSLALDAVVGAQPIVRSAQYMSRLIDDLLDTAAIDAGGMSITLRAHAVAELVSDAVETLRPVADLKRLVLTNVLPATQLRASCDRDRIIQVLSNLIGNAIKFTPEGGTITVGAESMGAEIRFSITDTGAGIPADQVARLFERFWHERGPQGGLGLGLYIAKGIVEAHGGRIWVESMGARGSSFLFTLPVGAPAAEA